MKNFSPEQADAMFEAIEYYCQGAEAFYRNIMVDVPRQGKEEIMHWINESNIKLKKAYVNAQNKKS